MKNLDPRVEAFKILNKVEKGGYATRLISEYLKYLDDRDGGLLYDLVYGVLRNRIYIDKILEKYSDILLENMDIKVKNALRLGIYQYVIRETPDYASVDTSVNLVREKSKRSFVNAVLRSITRSSSGGLNPIPDKDVDYAEYLRIRYSQEKIFIKNMLEFFGKKTTERVCNYFNRPAHLFLRVNRKVISSEQLMKILMKYNYNIQAVKNFEDFLHSWGGSFGIFDTIEFKNGYFSAQDVSQGVGAIIMSKYAGSIIGDICSGVGGKASYISELIGRDKTIISIDRSPAKIKVLSKNLKRLGHKNIFPVCAYINDFNRQVFNTAILDVPCSNSGNFGRHPEARYRLSEERLKRMVAYQRELIITSLKSLKSDGILIYNTCSIIPSECHLLLKSLEYDGLIRVIDPMSDCFVKRIIDRANFIVNDYGIYIMPYSFEGVVSSGGFVGIIKSA
ncbi:MAG: hypothetical protein DRH44_06990 [Candidatus Coatesbacteria bacterium]|nr:MAG: hypothetical protein DRH44_06990 [Candidatus Coatesbacteria bacterium]